MPHLYKNVTGWFTYSDLYDEMVEKYRHGDFVEIGCWFGQSSTYLLEKIDELRSGAHVTFVDSWIGGEEEPERDFVLRNGFDVVYQQFLDNLEIAFTDYTSCAIIREFSNIAAKKFKEDSCDFIFIDAGHRGWQCYDDMVAWWPKLKNGGTFAGHDIDFIDVKNSVEIFCKENNLNYRTYDGPTHCWRIDK